MDILLIVVVWLVAGGISAAGVSVMYDDYLDDEDMAILVILAPLTLMAFIAMATYFLSRKLFRYIIK